MPRKYTRKIKGGNLNIENIKPNIQQLQEDVIRISKDVEELGKNLGLSVPEHNVIPEEPVVILEEPVVIPEEPVVVPNQDIKPKTIKVTDFGDGIIKDITVEEILNSIQNKIKQTRKNKQNTNIPKKQEAYNEEINKYNNFYKTIANAMANNNINEIQSIWDSKPANIVFKNNKIMGGKTQKIQKKQRRNNKTRK
jgi:hypothetical protein